MSERLRGGLVHRWVGGLSRGACGLGLDELALNDEGPRRRLCSTHKTWLQPVHLFSESSTRGERGERVWDSIRRRAACGLNSLPY